MLREIEALGQGAALLIEVQLDWMNTHSCRQVELQSFTPDVWSYCSFKFIMLLNKNHSWVVFQKTQAKEGVGEEK